MEGDAFDGEPAEDEVSDEEPIYDMGEEPSDSEDISAGEGSGIFEEEDNEN